MKIACIEAFRQPLVIKDLPIPEVGPEEILVKIFASGVCHSDVHLADGEMPNFSSPIYPGHEGAGVVQKTGEKVDTIKVGDRVGVFLLGRTCGGRCHLCLRGYEIICPEAQFLGASVPGCHAEFVAVDHKFAVKLPSELKFTEVASFMCAGLTVYRGIRESRVVAPGWFTVIGIGGLGHLAVQFAKAMGFRVVAVDIDDSKLDLAKSLGAELVVNSSKEDPVKKLQREIQVGVEFYHSTSALTGLS